MDLLDQLAAIEEASAAAMQTAPPAVPVHEPEPVPGSSHNVTISLDGTVTTNESTTVERALLPYQDQAPTRAPASAPTPEPAPTPPEEPNPAPAPAPAPEVRIPDHTPRRVYAHAGMTEENKLLLGLLDANPGLSPEAIFAAFNAQLGRPAPQVPAAPSTATTTPEPPPAPEPEVTYDTVASRLEAIDAELADLDPVVDANEWKKLTIEANKLNRQLPALQLQQTQQQVTEDQRADAAIAQTRAAVSNAYPTITAEVFDIIEDPSKPITLITDPVAQAFAVRYRNDQAARSPLMEATDYELLVAASVAQQFGILPQQKAPVATAPGATPAAAPQQRPATQPQAQPGVLPVTAMPAISGAVHTSADRVTTTPVNALNQVQNEYQEALAAGNYEALERLSALMATGGQSPQQAFAGLNISYS